MNNLDIVYLSAVIIFLIPLLWSAGIWGMRALLPVASSTTYPDDRNEKLILTIMILPAIAGVALCAGALLFPEGLAALPVSVAPGSAQPVLPIRIDFENAAGGSGWALPLLILFAVFYCLGVVITAFRLFLSYLHLEKIIRKAWPADTASNIDILVTENTVSPFASLCRKIVIPEILLTELTSDQLRLIVAHECAHLNRGDATYFLLLAVLDTVFWFNPFVRLQSRRCRMAAEIACDNAVTVADPKRRKPYAMAIVSTLEIIAGAPNTAATASFTGRPKGEFEMRIRGIMNNDAKPVKPKRALVAAMLLLVVPVSTIQFALAEASSTNSAEFPLSVLSGKITSSFGMRPDPLQSDRKLFHKGVDIKAPIGTPVTAPADGIIVSTKTLPDSYGLLLTIDHGNGFVTRYANLSAFDVEPGERVRAGDTVARVGSTGRSTGPHLHIEVLKDGDHINPASVLILPENK